MIRIAFFGPLPPSNTGIADYNAALLPLLRQNFEIDVFLPGSHSSEGFHHEDFFLRSKQHPYDLTLYQMGNQPHFHEYMYGYLFQHPGAVMFHDYCLHHSRADMLLKRNMTEEYRQELQYVYPEQANRIANAAVTFAAGDLLFFRFPLFELVLRASLAAAAHTNEAVKQLQIGSTPVIKIPHPELRGTTGSARLLPGKVVVASFGYATEAKRLSTILESLSAILPGYSNLVYVIVGEIEDPVALQKRLEAHRIQERVMVTGHVEMQEFLAWMSRADIIINLRYPSAGEMSGTLIRSLALSKPVIISRLQSLQEIPENAVLRVRPDHELEDLTSVLSALLKDQDLRNRLSFHARQYIESQHSEKAVLEGYKNLIEIALARKHNFIPPELPLHLRSGKEILINHLSRTTFASLDSKILELITSY